MNKIFAKWIVIFSLFLFQIACSDSVFKSDSPVTLTLWHVCGDQTDSPMNALVEHFNQDVGRGKGIIVNITSLSNSTDIHFALVAAAKKYPGAGELPDIFISYPKTALDIGQDRLVDWKDYFPEEKLAEFVPSFLAEGEINGRLLILPVAKSSSALFVNATIFDQFARESGVRYEDLATWEGMFRTAKLYNQWSGGKAFFKYDDWLHYGLINTTALGGEFFQGNSVNFQDQEFQRIWSQLAASAVSGEVCLLSGYTTTAMMTGETLCGISSTAAVLYYHDRVIFPDNTSIPLRLKVLPVPYFEGGRRLAVQRGGGLGLVKSTPEKERAAAVFAEWLTAVENNVPFAVETGYFPVKTKAYENFLSQPDLPFKNERYRDLYSTIQQIQAEYQFYIPPFFENYGEVEKAFSEVQLDLFKKYRKQNSDAPLDLNYLPQQILIELESSMK